MVDAVLHKIRRLDAFMVGHWANVDLKLRSSHVNLAIRKRLNAYDCEREAEERLPT
jgi:hypothetical protein